MSVPSNRKLLCSGRVPLIDILGVRPPTVAAVANHRVDAGGSQAWMLFQHLSHEPEVGIDYGSAQRLRAFELLRLNRVTHRLGFRERDRLWTEIQSA